MCEYDRDPTKVTGILGIVDAIVTGIVNLQIYPLNHPRVTSTVDDLVARFEQFAIDKELEQIRIGVEDGYIVFDKRPVLGATLSGPRFLDAIESLGIGGLEIERGVNKVDIEAMLRVLCDRGRSMDDHEDVARALAQHGSKRIRPLDLAGVGAAAAPESRERSGVYTALSTPIAVYQNVVDVLQSVTVDICRGDQFSIEQAHDRVSAVLHHLDADPTTVHNLSRYEQYDAFTFGHSVRVSVLAMDYARLFVDSDEMVTRIGLAALLHDVGKALVPFEILHAKRRLDEAERNEMEKHAASGAELLLDVANPDPMAVAAAFGHHRTHDGAGYPAMLHGAPASTVTKLIKICDVYEALTANRPYKSGMSPTRAYQIMMTMKGHFHPGLLRQFVLSNGIYPVGYDVELTSGEVGVVLRQTGELRAPVVRTKFASSGDRLHAEDEREIDLTGPGGRRRSIVSLRAGEPMTV